MSLMSKLFRIEFDALRSHIEDDPSAILKDSEIHKQKYQHLQEIHYRFFAAYANVKLMNFRKAEASIQEIMSEAIVNDDYFMMIHANLLLAQCFRKDPQKVHTCLSLAEDIARKSEDAEALVEVLSHQGDFLFHNDQFKAAEEKHLSVQNILQGGDLPARKMRSLLSLALINRAMGQPSGAIKHLQEALSICRKEKYADYELILLNKLAMIQIDIEHYNEAEDLLKTTIDLCAKQKRKVQKLQSVFSLAALYLKMGKADNALTRLQESATLAEQEGFTQPLFKLDLSYNFAEAYQQKQDYEKAGQYFEDSLALAREHSVPDAEYEAMMCLAQIHIINKQYEKAESLLLSCLSICRKLKNADLLISTQEALARLYLKMRDYPRCVQMMQKQISGQKKKIEVLQKEISHNIDTYVNTSTDYHPRDPQTEVPGTDDYGFVGNSDAQRKVLHAALLAAQYPNANVIIMGESGTGKEVIASIIHKSSLRKAYPFVPVNAAAISPSLVESELFGHTKGSFTGATTEAKGFFQQANKGTLFIDEITEMPLELQAKLLRAIESHKISPVGSSVEIPVDCRIISSTNLNIYDLIKINQFRLDLFHRINTIEIYIPPLRDRTEDIPPLVEHFVRQHALLFKRPTPHLDQSFYDSMMAYAFPGNVRELKNIIERLFIMSTSDNWNAGLLQTIGRISPVSDPRKNQQSSSASQEEERIKKALIRTGGIQREAAKLLKMSNSTMTRRIQKYHLEAYTQKGK